MLVNLHCHSAHSDGTMPVPKLVEALADGGVRLAALTDHETLVGLDEFQRELARRGIGFVTGVELQLSPETHLLAYGFDPHNAELLALLRNGNASRATLEQVCSTVHRAGGTVFLAHPLTFCPEIDELPNRLASLQAAGLDGIEALYGPYPPSIRARLLEMADRLGLLVSAGTDFHGFDRHGLSVPAIDFPQSRLATFCRANRVPEPDDRGDPTEGILLRRTVDAVRSSFAWKRFAWRIVIPTVLAATLFVLTIFAVIVPIFRDSLMERKRETIRELINSAWSILDDAHRQELAGPLTTAEAQERARQRIESLRYGKERKDYFWITDLHPRMLMHPYRADLNGADLTDFADVRGRRLFVESVRLARERGEGFVEYYWQWNDNPERLVPKQSFIRLFEPWGWIIGTGIYLDDVHAEIDRLTYRLLAWCLGITAIISLLLGYITRESMRIERRRLAAEDDLRQSHEKYAALVQASSEGTLMVLDGRCVFANPTIAQMLGYSPSEMTALSLDELLPAEANAAVLSRVRALLDGDPTPASLELTFAARDSLPVRVLASISRVALAGKSGLILVARDLSHPHPLAGSTLQLPDDPVLEELRASLLFLSEPLKSVLSPAPRCDLDTRIIDAARMMGAEPGGVLTVTSGANGPVIGIVTDQDLRQRVLLERIPAIDNVARVMSSPVLALPDTAPVHEALSLMRQQGISHLGVRDERGDIVGVVKDAQLLQFHQFSSTALASSIRAASSVSQIAEVRSKLPRLVRALLDAGARPRNVNRIATRLSDAIVLRLVELAGEELGPMPGPFCFLALGSEGRGEQTLATDQDNALLYIDPAHHEHFLKLGGRVCTALDQVGYAFCLGENMARNPRYCRSLSEWIGQFRNWIAASNPQDLLEFSIFFDFRCVAGEPSLARDLRVSVRHALAEHPPFFLHMANSILAMRTPVGWFGRLALESSPDHPNALNLKDAMLPMVSFARLYALRQGVEATNTLDRIEQLSALQVLRRDFADELAQAYTFLMQLRLQRQTHDLAAGRPADNLIDPSSLTPMEQTALRQALNVIATLRKKVSYDFLGMA